MKLDFNSIKNSKHTFWTLLGLVFVQFFALIYFFTQQDKKTYEVNLVKINNEKDSINAFQLKNDLLEMDETLQTLHQFLQSKNATDLKIEKLSQDSLGSSVYLAKTANRYSQYLVDLEKKLQEIPLGIPTEGYISSNFGMRKNPIPVRKMMLASLEKPKPSKEKGETDSLGNPVQIKTKAVLAKDEAPAEEDQMQFHKGIDVAVAYGSDVKCAAKGKVIFAGQKGGYGNCVIVQHGNGLSTLYAHLSEILVSSNQEVKVGEVLAKSGNSGRSTGPHLHYEVHKNNTPVNPKLFLSL